MLYMIKKLQNRVTEIIRRIGRTTWLEREQQSPIWKKTEVQSSRYERTGDGKE